MRKLLVFQHVPYEPLGRLDGLFREAGLQIHRCDFHREPQAVAQLGRHDGLVVLGGPMAADETDRFGYLAYEQAAIREAAERDMPVLGICLGAQLIAASLGGRTLRGAAIERGWHCVAPTEAGAADPVIGRLGESEPIFQWHSDTFTLPPGAVHLAHSATCDYQAFRIGERVYGFQFHLEADRPLIERWLEDETLLRALEARGVRVDPARVLRETEAKLPRAEALGRAVFGAFIERFLGPPSP